VSDMDGQDKHTLSVKDVHKLFIEKGVAITERSVVRYCKKRNGVSLLDCIFDENETKLLITPESAENAIEEKKALGIGVNGVSDTSPDSGKTAQDNVRQGRTESEETNNLRAENSELKKENLDLKITNRGKDIFIDMAKEERQSFVRQAKEDARRIGELETRLELGSGLEVKEGDVVVEEVAGDNLGEN